jgi:hypothetical protein
VPPQIVSGAFFTFFLFWKLVLEYHMAKLDNNTVDDYSGNQSPKCSQCEGLINPALTETKYDHLKDEYIKIKSQLPWNADWEGRCQHCGYDYSNSFTGFEENQKQSYRKLKISPTMEVYKEAFEQNLSLAGLEINLLSCKGSNKKEVNQTIFLTMAELKYIINQLDTDLAPLKSQFSIREDLT